MTNEAILRFMGGNFIVVGLGVAALLLARLARAWRSRGWPSVTGHIDAAGLRRVEFTANFGGSADIASALVPDFRYRYTVAGQDYEGRRVGFADTMVRTRGALERLQRRFRPGKAVRVYYDPAHPATSVLQPGPDWRQITPLFTAAGMVGIGLWLWHMSP